MGEVEEGGVVWEGAEGTSWGPGISALGMSEVEKGGVEDVREETGWSEETSLATRAGGGGEDRRHAGWPGGGDVIMDEEMLAGDAAEGSEVEMALESDG